MQPQIILITGASSGFGKITAQMLSEQGHIVYGTSRKPSENIGKVRMLVVDVTNSISVRQAVEQIISEQGRMDVLIINPEKPDVPLNKNDAFQKVQKRRVQEKR